MREADNCNKFASKRKRACQKRIVRHKLCSELCNIILYVNMCLNVHTCCTFALRDGRTNHRALVDGQAGGEGGGGRGCVMERIVESRV